MSQLRFIEGFEFRCIFQKFPKKKCVPFGLAIEKPPSIPCFFSTYPIHLEEISPYHVIPGG